MYAQFCNGYRTIQKLIFIKHSKTFNPNIYSSLAKHGVLEAGKKKIDQLPNHESKSLFIQYQLDYGEKIKHLFFI